MIKALSFFLTLFFFIAAGVAFAGAPYQVGGFVLGQDIKSFEDRVIMDTMLQV
jgi:hypothetical protein